MLHGMGREKSVEKINQWLEVEKSLSIKGYVEF